jgi:hypothetical protein
MRELFQLILSWGIGLSIAVISFILVIIILGLNVTINAFYIGKK